MAHSPRAIIIGAGIAGLATAIRLAVLGYNVTVFEKNSYPGGKISLVQTGGYRFDAGPSLFTQPQNIEELFKVAGEPIEEYFQYQPVPVACKYFYEDGKVVNAYTDPDAFANELSEQLGEDPQKVISYLLQSEKLYNRVGAIFLDYSLHKTDILKAPLLQAVGATRFKHLFGTLNSINQAHFTQAHTVQLFNRYATYNGSNPYKAPGMLSLIPHLEQNLGTFYPQGGMISIAEALYKLAIKKGVRFNFSAGVERIIQTGGVATGVVANGTQHNAEVIVSNADVYFTYKNLLNKPLAAANILKNERSSSAIIFYWGIKKEFSQLHLHNILFSKDYKAEFNSIFNQKNLYSDPTVYINITSKYSNGHAPQGCENWFVMVNAPANCGQNWTILKNKARAAIITKLNRMLGTDINPLIEAEETLDPVSIEVNTASYMGSLYGTSSNSKFAAFLRHPNFSSRIKGLYFAGGSVHPGGGIPLCLKSARLVSQMIAADNKKSKRP